MSNSRRGLLAAGLVTVVVGSMGVVWTLNANAGETPPAETPAAVAAPVAAAAAEEPQLVPPKLLPWGEKPTELKLAKAGASSKAVAAAGADAAPADTSGSLVPKPAWAPKGGHTLPGNTPRPRRTKVAPPAPPGVKGAARVDESRFGYHYAGAYQYGATDGTWASLTIENPALAKTDHHTLAEITVMSGEEDGHRQIVEVGWNVDYEVNKDYDAHLFVYHWVDKKETCYNKCGFTISSTAKILPGATLPFGTQKRFGIVHSGGAWWIAYDSVYVGAFPDSNWGGRYTKGGLTQWFGEVASPAGVTPCSAMGNGLTGDKGLAARLGSITLTNGPELAPTVWSTRSDYYSAGWTLEKSVHTVRYGGPGGPKATDANPNLPC